MERGGQLDFDSLDGGWQVFLTPTRSETSTIIDAAKLAKLSWWQLMQDVNLLVRRPFPVYTERAHFIALQYQVP